MLFSGQSKYCHSVLVLLRVLNKFANAKIFGKFTQTKYIADIYSAYSHDCGTSSLGLVGGSVSIRSRNPDQLVGKK